MTALLAIAEFIRRSLEWVAHVSGWLMVVMATVITFDVLARKAGVELPYTPGHENAGWVHEVGSAVTNVAVG